MKNLTGYLQRYYKRTSLLTYSLLLSIIFLMCSGSEGVRKRIFVSGTNGYNTYRIPALLSTEKGTILAFCEGRKNSKSDAGDIDVILRRSNDNGKTWLSQQIIWDDSNNTCGNPSPIYDRVTGQIHLLITWNNGNDKEKEIINETSIDTRRIYITSSSNDGLSWTEPKEITNDVKESNWTWYATGPGAGIQIERGKYKNRLISPCDHIEAKTKKYFSHIIYSDDHGKSWNLGGSSPKDQVNECQVVEISGNRLLLNMRNYDRNKKMRQIAQSKNGGETWHSQKFDEELIEPICQASLLHGSWNDSGLREFLAFSNPSDSVNRINMSIKFSFDEGNSWPVSRIIHKGASAYSDLNMISDNIIACLFESGKDNPYEEITFVSFPIHNLIP